MGRKNNYNYILSQVIKKVRLSRVFSFPFCFQNRGAFFSRYLCVTCSFSLFCRCEMFFTCVLIFACVTCSLFFKFVTMFLAALASGLFVQISTGGRQPHAGSSPGSHESFHPHISAQQPLLWSFCGGLSWSWSWDYSVSHNLGLGLSLGLGLGLWQCLRPLAMQTRAHFPILR